MKPPPRTRIKPTRGLKHEQETRGKALKKWQRVEQKKLVTALKTLSRKTGGHGDIDYSFLMKQVTTRSISEIQSVVELLKKKVISSVNLKLTRKSLEDQKIRKPIEEWTHMASAVVGTLEGPISAAFSQMLVISSTEPRTLRNSDPPQVHGLSTNSDRPVGRIIAPSCLRGESLGTAQPKMLFKTPAPTKRLLPLVKVVRVSNDINQNPPHWQCSTNSPAVTCSSLTTLTSSSSGTAEINVASSNGSQPLIPNTVGVQTHSGDCSVKQTPQEWSKQLPLMSSISILKSNSSSPHTPLPSPATNVSVLPTTTPLSSVSSSVPVTSCSSSSTSSVPTLSIPVAVTHAKSNSTSKHVEKDKSLVDFEKIYRYLSVVHKPDNDCHLTPMESAIILNLLMSLPEELPLLDCTKLHQHLVQMLQVLTSPAKSKRTRETLDDLNGGLSAQTSKPSGQGNNATDSQQQTSRTVDRSADQEDAESQSPGNKKGENQSVETDRMGYCPPLNPFVVPLKLLMHT